MFILENALRNLVMNRGRYILLGLVIFAIVAASVASLSIFNHSNRIIDNYKNQYGSEVSITAPRHGGNNNASGGNEAAITLEQYLAFAESEYLLESMLSGSLGCSSTDITPFGEDTQTSGQISTGDVVGGDLENATLRLRGGYLTEFENGKRAVVDGQMPQASGESLISTDLADLNGLTVGDSITINAVLFDKEGAKIPVNQSLTITGLYYDTTDEYATPAKRQYLNKRNEILTTFDTLSSMQGNELSGIGVSATYYLKDPAMLDSFTAELRSKGLDSSYTVATDKAGYRRFIAPVESLKKVSILFMSIVLALGAVILVLLSVMSIRERKYEIGVLRAIGMKRGKVTLGLWLELLILTVLCYGIGLSAGALVSQPISNIILASQLDKTPESVLTATQPLSNISVSISLMTAVEIFAIAIILASLAGVISIGNITKYEPSKILRERT